MERATVGRRACRLILLPIVPTFLLYSTGVVGIRTEAVPNATAYEWCATYVLDGFAQCWISEGSESSFDPRNGLEFTVRVRGLTNEVPTGWSDASASMIQSPCPGDIDYDNLPGGPDFSILGMRFGMGCSE
jgi:hypothetical protein